MRNLAAVALAAIARELEDDPAGAGEALARLLGNPPRSEAGTAQAPPAHATRTRDDKPKKRRPPPRPKLVRGGEAAELARQLVERHGTVVQAARALGTSPATFRGWRDGNAVKPATLEKLRDAVAAPHRGDEAQGDEDEGERLDPLDLDPLDTSEAADLAGELAGRYGSVEQAAESTGIMLGSLPSWQAGGPITERALARLREAARAPVGRATPVGARRRRREASDAGEEPAGAAEA